MAYDGGYDSGRARGQPKGALCTTRRLSMATHPLGAQLSKASDAPDSRARRHRSISGNATRINRPRHKGQHVHGLASVAAAVVERRRKRGRKHASAAGTRRARATYATRGVHGLAREGRPRSLWHEAYTASPERVAAVAVANGALTISPVG